MVALLTLTPEQVDVDLPYSQPIARQIWCAAPKAKGLKVLVSCLMA